MEIRDYERGRGRRNTALARWGWLPLQGQSPKEKFSARTPAPNAELKAITVFGFSLIAVSSASKYLMRPAEDISPLPSDFSSPWSPLFRRPLQVLSGSFAPSVPLTEGVAVRRPFSYRPGLVQARAAFAGMVRPVISAFESAPVPEVIAVIHRLDEIVDDVVPIDYASAGPVDVDSETISDDRISGDLRIVGVQNPDPGLYSLRRGSIGPCWRPILSEEDRPTHFC